LFILPRYLTAESLNSTATKPQEAVRCITFGTESRWANLRLTETKNCITSSRAHNWLPSS